jgi:ADP-ribose pyrophosphatase YjhB (NUDIX family)
MTGDQPPGAHASIDTTPAEARGWPLRRYHTAGGIVVRDGRALLLHRIKGHVGEVRLPKGHVEPGETEEAAAVREVQEETGLRYPRIVKRLGTLDNHFAFGRHRYQRREAWFLMAAENLASAAAEAQWRPEWHPLDEAEGMLTFEAERIVLRWARTG